MPSNNNYNPLLRRYAREHRKNFTKAEIKVWKKLLRARMMMGYQFLRQRPIQNYIVDFFCKDLQLIIEIDGLSHLFEESFAEDVKREEKLKSLGYRIIRFTDNEVEHDFENVYRSITGWIEKIEEENPQVKVYSERNYYNIENRKR